MSEADTVALFGDTIGITYMDSSGVYHSVSAYYTQSPEILGLANQWNDATGYTISGRYFLPYQFQTEGTLNAEPRNITVDISCQYSIFDTEFIYTCAAIPCDYTTNISAYNSPTWDWVWSGSQVQFSPSDLAVNNVLPQIYMQSWCDFVPAYMDSQALTSGYSLRLTFDHASLSNGKYGRFYLGIPYVSDGASGYNGTSGLTTTISETTTTGINVNIDVDLDQTNGLLGTIATAIGNVATSILSGIRDLFVPTSQQLDDFFDDLEQMLYDKIAPLYDAVYEVNRAFTEIRSSGTDTHIPIDVVNIPLLDNDSFAMDLNVDENGVPIIHQMPGNLRTNGLLWACKKIIDIICTFAFINMCKTKIELILNPDAETIIEGGD